MMACLLVSSTAKRRRWWFVAGTVSLFAAAAAVVWYWSPPRPNIVLVTFDTTRADRLGAYGYQSGATRGFDDFARQGVVFEQAYAPAPITLPSHATMLTGLYPPEHGLRVNGSGRLPADIPYLPEILQEHGYDTGAFIAAIVLDSRYGLDRGFDVYDDDISRSDRHFGEHRRDGAQVVDLALAWLKERTSQPFFCWIHLYDAHAPYDPRADVYQQQFAQQPYDAGVAWEVEQFARLTEYLQERRLDEHTIVVVAGDHGEGLGDHLEHEHGMLVYNTTVQVPFVFVGPEYCPPGIRVDSAVSLVDLAPTLLDMLHIPAPGQVSGRSLVAALTGRPLEPRDCYIEAETPYSLNRWSPLRGVVSAEWKYIQTTRPELYDLEHDPAELTNLVETAGDDAERMSALLADMQQSFTLADADETDLSDGDLADLRALGYVSGGESAAAGSDPVDTAGLPDVKDFVPLVAKFEDAKHLSQAGQVDQAIVLLQSIVQATDQFPVADMLLGDSLTKVGRRDEAVTVYRSLLERRPEFERVRLNLGRVLFEQGRHAEAAAEFRETIRQSPDSAGAHFELAKALSQLQKFDEAVQEYRAALRIAPELVVANVSLGQLLAMRQQSGDAAACFEQALKYDPDNLAAHENLLIVLTQTGEFTKAIQHGEKAVALEPSSFETRFNLGILLIARQRYTEGIAQLRAAQKLRPDDPRPGPQIQQAEAAMRPGTR